MSSQRLSLITALILVISLAVALGLRHENASRRQAWAQFQNDAGQHLARTAEAARRQEDERVLQDFLDTLERRGWLSSQPPSAWPDFLATEAERLPIRLQRWDALPATVADDEKWRLWQLEASLLDENTLYELLTRITRQGPMLSELRRCRLTRQTTPEDPLLPLLAHCEFLVWRP